MSTVGGHDAVAVSEVALSWSAEHVVWPPAKSLHVARRKAPIKFRRTAAVRHRPRVQAPLQTRVKPHYASHILTLPDR